MKTFTVRGAAATPGIQILYDHGFGLYDVSVGFVAPYSKGAVARVGLTTELVASFRRGHGRLMRADIEPGHDGTCQLGVERNLNPWAIAVVKSIPETPTDCKLEIGFDAPVDTPPIILGIGYQSRRVRGLWRRYPEVVAVVAPETTITIRRDKYESHTSRQAVPERPFYWDGQDFVRVHRGRIELPDPRPSSETLANAVAIALAK